MRELTWEEAQQEAGDMERNDLHLFSTTAHHVMEDVRYLRELDDRTNCLTPLQRASFDLIAATLDELLPQVSLDAEKPF